MDFIKINENESKWRLFLSSIKGFSYLPSNNMNLKTKTLVTCLSSEFANKLLKNKGGTVEISSEKGVLGRYKHLDVRGSPSTLKQTESYNVDARADETSETPSVCRQIFHEEKDTGRITIDSSDEETFIDTFPYSKSTEDSVLTTIGKHNVKSTRTIPKSAAECAVPSKILRRESSEIHFDLINDMKSEIREMVGSRDFEDDQASKDSINDEHRNTSKISLKEQTMSEESDFSEKLLLKEGGMVVISSDKEVLNSYGHLDVRNSQSTPRQNDKCDVGARTAGTSETPFKHSVCQQIFLEEKDTGQVTINSSDEETNIIDTSPTSNKTEDSVLITSNGKHNVKSTETIHAECTVPNKILRREPSESHMDLERDMELAIRETEDDQAYNYKEPTKEEDRNLSKVPTKEQKKCDESAPSRLEVNVEDLWHLQDDIQIERVRERDSLPRLRKNDIDRPCSKWTLSNIAEYFVFENCVKEIKIPTTFDVYDIFLKVEDKIRELKAFKGIKMPKSRSIHVSDSICQIKSISANEAGCRLIIDAILIPVCLSFGYQIEIDKNINCSFLPNCRFDYCIKKEDTIIGCVETKSIKTLSQASVVQAILELMILQTTLFTRETTTDDFIDFPLFAIITDGHRFIYIQLEGSMLGFEHDDHKKVKVHEVREDDDFKTILQHICFLVNGGKDVRMTKACTPSATTVSKNEDTDVIVID